MTKRMSNKPNVFYYKTNQWKQKKSSRRESITTKSFSITKRISGHEIFSPQNKSVTQLLDCLLQNESLTTKRRFRSRSESSTKEWFSITKRTYNKKCIFHYKKNLYQPNNVVLYKKTNLSQQKGFPIAKMTSGPRG